MENKKTVYIDMDNVLVDFESGIEHMKQKPEYKDYKGEWDNVPGIFKIMKPMPDAIEAFNVLFDHFDVYILSTAPWDNNSSFSDKHHWVTTNLPIAYKRLTLTNHKHKSIGHYLIDDRTKNGAGEFKGNHIHIFTDPKFMSWKAVVDYLLDNLIAEIERDIRVIDAENEFHDHWKWNC